MSRQLYLNFIKDNRWKYIVNGLGTTLQITFFAVILGIALVPDRSHPFNL